MCLQHYSYAKAPRAAFGGTILCVMIVQKAEFGDTKQIMNPKIKIAGRSPI
jgi:hypothetical protein